MTAKIKADVCIVGTGFCGYAAYRNLIDSGLNVIVIEGGSIKSPTGKDDQKYYEVKQNKFVNKGKKLINSIDLSFRDRFFTLGGSSEAWSGYIVPLGKNVYKQKFDEWPFSWGSLDLSKYDNRALELIGSPIREDIQNIISEKAINSLPDLPDGFRYNHWFFSAKPLRLKKFWSNLLANSPAELTAGKPVLCDYRLNNFELKPDSTGIKSFIFNSPDKIELIVEANQFVIACGGLQNSFLASKIDKLMTAAKKNSGPRLNNPDKKIFVEHPHLYKYAAVKLSPGKSLSNLLISRVDLNSIGVNRPIQGKIKFIIEAGGSKGVPGLSFEFLPINNSLVSRLLNRLGLGQLKRIIRNEPQSFVEDVSGYDYYVHIRAEQIPQISSSIHYTDEKIAIVNWEISDSDLYGYSEITRRLLGWFQSTSLFERVCIPAGTPNNIALPSKDVHGGAHHMTTYPYDSSNTFLDEYFRSVNSENVYIVGSSAFPITGWENPTVCAIATALHATDHLKTVAKANQSP